MNIRICAIIAISLILSLRPCAAAGSSDDLSRQAQEYAEQGQFTQAIEAFQKLIEREGSGRDICMRLGDAFQRSGRANEAITAFRDAIAADPEYAAAYARVGRVLFESGLYRDAVAWYRAAINRAPGHAQERLELGLALIKINDFTAARRQLSRLFALDPARAEELRAAIAGAGRNDAGSQESP